MNSAVRRVGRAQTWKNRRPGAGCLIPVLLPVLVGLFCAAQAEARDFYVDCSRRPDAVYRQRPGSVWHTLAEVNRFALDQSFRPGDRILLRRGCHWHEELDLSNGDPAGVPRNSGSAASPLVISSYGSGDLPTIDAADPVSSRWKAEGHGVYSTRIEGSVYKVFVDGENHETEALLPQPNFVGPWQPQTKYFMWDYTLAQGKTVGAMRDVEPQERFRPDGWYHAPSLSPQQQTSGLANVSRMPNSWYFDARTGVLYLHLGDGGDPSAHAIFATRRCYGIHLDGVNHVVVDGLRIIHAAKSGILAGVHSPNHGHLPLGNEFNTVENCVFWNEGDISIDTLPGSVLQVEGAISIAASTIPTDSPLRGWVIRNNAVGLMDNAYVFLFGRSGISAVGTAGLTLQNNYIATQYAMGVSVYTDRGPRCADPRIENNDFAANQGNLRVSGCTSPLIDSNTIAYSYGYGIQTGGNTSGAVVTHNLIHNLSITIRTNAFNGLDCNGGAPGGTLAFNTIDAVWAANATLEVGCDHWTVHDNVFDSSNNAQHGGLTLYIRREALPGMIFRHDIYRVDPRVARQFNVGAGLPGAHTFHDFHWWQQNMEPTAVLANEPLFVDKDDGNYALRRASEFGAGPRLALPVHPFVPTAASAIYLRESLKEPWQPQDAFR